MSISPTNNIPSQHTLPPLNESPSKTGKNNNSSSRATTASHQQPVEQNSNINAGQQLQIKKTGLNPSNLA